MTQVGSFHQTLCAGKAASINGESDVYTLETAPNYVIRTNEFDDIQYYCGDDAGALPGLPRLTDTISYLVEKVRLAEAEFNEIKRLTGVAIPKMWPRVDVYGNPDPSDKFSRASLFTPVQKVSGDMLLLAAVRNPALIEEIDPVMCGFVDYLVSRYKSGNTIWIDIKNEQFIWGRTAGETEDRIYMVDVDPLISTDGIQITAQRGMYELGSVLLSYRHNGLDLPRAIEKFLTCGVKPIEPPPHEW